MLARGNNYKIYRDDLLYPELSFEISGVLFQIFKHLGSGHRERYYQKAVKVGLEKKGIKYKEQFYVPIRFEGELIGKYYLDFLIEDKIVLELKRGKYIPANVINQTKQYLESLEMKLGLIACFTHTSVHVKRIINHY
ncbi:GxxExxY protein [Patescibacteria group bacterium]|nr:GxxExxY protein [Patescibacteria group bacterium]MBU1895269.1 GxxExxY protein [Patescibacteria group bacterium]